MNCPYEDGGVPKIPQTMNDVPKGYKQTEVGVIPEDWVVEPLQNFVNIERGKFTARPRNDPKYYGGDIPFIQTGDVTNSNGRITNYCQTLNALGVKVSKIFPRGTLFFTIAANIGDVGFTTFDTACPDSLVAMTPTKSCDENWLFHELARRKSSFETIATQNAQLNINLEKLRPYLLPRPPLLEQRAIATTLSDVDALIAKLDQLLAKKRDLKQAAMQELLTGRRRLPGFTGEWVQKQLGALCAMRSGEAITSSRIDGFSRYPCYGGNGLRGFTARFTHEGRHALIGRQGALCGNVFAVRGQFFASEHAVVVTAFADTDIAWLTYVLGRMNLNQYSESSAQPGLSVAKILKLVIAAPECKEEQTAIAAVLSDMDAEITALEARRDKTKSLKQGMMQELLTGRIRLV